MVQLSYLESAWFCLHARPVLTNPERVLPCTFGFYNVSQHKNAGLVLTNPGRGFPARFRFT